MSLILILCRKEHAMQTYRLLWGVVLMAAVVAWGGWGTPQALAQRARVPQTGQTTCWDAAGSPINCAGTGQDGDIQAGVEWPIPRFTDRHDGTVRDNLTGLIWLKNANCFSNLAWSQALIAANTLASPSCGLSDGSQAGDWRLPNIKELLSLIDYGQFEPALPDGHPFSNVQSEYFHAYWSSTSNWANSGAAWIIWMQHGNISYYGKAGPLPVWPVRRGD
jgi:hypothetical protein